mgnify:CR=1 FL=1
MKFLIIWLFLSFLFIYYFFFLKSLKVQEMLVYRKKNLFRDIECSVEIATYPQLLNTELVSRLG